MRFLPCAQFIPAARVRLKLCALAAAAMLLPATHAAAQYPERPIKLIVPYAAGGSADLVARIAAEGMRAELGQPVVVENKPGGGGLLGTQLMLQAPPDGYTIALGTFGNLVVNPLVFPNSGIDYDTDIVPISNLALVPAVLMVHPEKYKARDFESFLAETKGKPGHYNMATSGKGGGSHLLLESLNHQLGIELTHVPYRGQGPALQDTMAGVTDIIADQAPSALPIAKAGKLVPIAVFGPKRFDALPSVPTLTELGYPQLDKQGISWFGLIAPRNTPPAIIERLHAAAAGAVKSAATSRRLADAGAIPLGNSPQEFRKEYQEAQALSREVVKRANIKFDN